MARKLDRLTLGVNDKGSPFQRLWQKNCETAEANNADLQDQIDAITNLNDDNTLTPAKKPVWIFMYSFLTGEQSALDSEATTYGITTEKTNYDNAVSALTTYLGTLTAAVSWNNLTGNTTIVGTTFRTKFNDVLVNKQALLNKMHDTARSLANTAQGTANTATTNAATAQTTANTATTNAATAQTTADTVKRDDSISTSWTSPGVILSATDAGTNATITITGHTRKYTDVSNASVTGSTITGLAYSTQYYVYYDQTSRAGGGVTFHATTDPNVAQPGAAAGRHYCGDVTTPASGGAATSGGVDAPAGGGGITRGQVP
jgi:methyl-accepting chemotaxis protein